MHISPVISPGVKPSEGAVSPEEKVLVVIPVYNHAKTLRTVAEGVLRVHSKLLIVDDGSTDLPSALNEEHPLYGLPVRYVRLPKNQGKGATILKAAAIAEREGMTHILTIDADGQHSPEDIPRFFAALRETPLAIIVGARDFSVDNVPGSSRFGRKFSNFWFKVHTSEETEDVQSGFRLYPLAVLSVLGCRESRYSFETEVLVKASWAGFSVRNVPVHVFYPPKAERISHFSPFWDNLRISLLNTRLTIRSILPVPQKKYHQDSSGRISVLHPLRSLRRLLADRATPQNLALAAAVGMFIGTLPLFGLHSILIILLCGAWKLNKLTGLAISQLCIPPFVPASCIEIGHFLRYKKFLTELSVQSLGYEAPARLLEWILGSLLLAPVLAGLLWLMVFILAILTQRALQQEVELSSSR